MIRSHKVSKRRMKNFIDNTWLINQKLQAADKRSNKCSVSDLENPAKLSEYSRKKAAHLAYTWNCDINCDKELPMSVNEILNMKDSEIREYRHEIPLNRGSYRDYLISMYLVKKSNEISDKYDKRRAIQKKFDSVKNRQTKYYRIFDRTYVRSTGGKGRSLDQIERVFGRGWDFELSDNLSHPTDIVNALYETNPSAHTLPKIERVARRCVKTIARRQSFTGGFNKCQTIVDSKFEMTEDYKDIIQIVGLTLLQVGADTQLETVSEIDRPYYDLHSFDYYIHVDNGELFIHYDLMCACYRSIERMLAKMQNPKFETQQESRKAEKEYEESDEEDRRIKVGYLKEMEDAGIQTIVDYIPEIQSFYNFMAEKSDKWREYVALLELKANGCKSSDLERYLDKSSRQIRRMEEKIKQWRYLYYKCKSDDPFYRDFKSFDKFMRENR